MDEIALLFRNPQNSAALKNYNTMELVIQANWKEALIALATYPTHDPNSDTPIPWTGTTRQILVEACEHKTCPSEIIDAILRTGIYFHIPRACLNPGGIGAMTPVNVCAERGSLEALKALVAHGAYIDTYALSLACIHGNANVLDYLLTLPYSYNSGHGMVVNTTMRERSSPTIMEHIAREHGHLDVIFPVLTKHFPWLEKK